MARKAKKVGSNGGNLYERANDMFVKVTAQDTNGSYEVCEERCPAGFASRPHLHTVSHETFYVIEGSATFILGKDEHKGKVGDLIHIPPGIPHQMIAGEDGVRVLMVYSPGTTEAMFADMTALTPEERSDFKTGAAVAAKHNTVWVENFPKP
jgi:mannose-6-phosphate isomerase-like protein (cupin superfamily)